MFQVVDREIIGSPTSLIWNDTRKEWTMHGCVLLVTYRDEWYSHPRDSREFENRIPNIFKKKLPYTLPDFSSAADEMLYLAGKRRLVSYAQDWIEDISKIHKKFGKTSLHTARCQSLIDYAEFKYHADKHLREFDYLHSENYWDDFVLLSTVQ